MLTRILRKVHTVLASRWFFRATIGFFVFEALWIAFSAAYPQAFDEDFHFGIIQIYSHHWLPFLGAQPGDADAYGALARDPSFLYHYLLSFPYRLLSLFLHDTVQQVVALRIINVALFTAGLLLFRRVLQRAGLSKLLSNLCFALVVLIPIVPQVAGQINYDNLMMLLTGAACLLTFTVIDQFTSRKPSYITLGFLLATCLIATVVKYEFLPIFAAIVGYLGFLSFRSYKGRWRQALHSANDDWHRRSRLSRLAALLLFIVAFALFAQRDIVNVLQYHAVAPDCAKVLTVKECSAYSVWIHDYQSHQAVVAHQVSAGMNPLFYLVEWIYWLWYRLFFAINGGADHLFTNYPPLPLPAACFALLGVASIGAIIAYRRSIFARKPYLALLATIVIIYLLALLSQGYIKYRSTGVLELMNGRYLLPILLPAMALGGLALARGLRAKPLLRSGLAMVVVLCFLQGGGLFTFLSRSDESWNLDNATVRATNSQARSAISPFIIDGPKEYSTSIWFFN